MPYIKSNDNRRKLLQQGDIAQTAGELNYQIFYYVKHNITEKELKVMPDRCAVLIEEFVRQFLGNYPNYQRYNDMVGCLILCAKEIKRRLKLDISIYFQEIIDSYDSEIANYENTKITSNGDVE